MKFRTKLWRRSEKSFATTIPQAMLFLLDDDKKYRVEWIFDAKQEKWYVDFLEAKSTSKAKFSTILWKRSQRSYATTMPHAVLLHMDEEKENFLEWEFDKKLQKWTVSLKEAGK